MPKKIYVYPYKMASGSAREIARGVATGGPNRIKPSAENSRYNPSANHVIVNWGASDMHIPMSPAKILNMPDAVKLAGNKLKTLVALDGHLKIPEFTAETAIARGWEGAVIARRTLTGCGGEGIDYYEDARDISMSNTYRLFTKYIKKTKEYRVHVFKMPDGSYNPFRIQMKKLRMDGSEEFDNVHIIRNHTNGWVFSTNFQRAGETWSEEIVLEAIKTIQTLGLDFGAVDIIWNRVRGVYVLEVNTAPGAEADTATEYATQIKTYA